ncbi:sodium channel protein Nach-like [Neocloeon triangulifer]|uniref:sodium channel protein Nach-like n=1 Tax=Neocloeon triangulifer TaxID=2078957 RepID=UPI00286F12F4|nr:sodium channel protein Nach-like [Neocloeon triangulifer]
MIESCAITVASVLIFSTWSRYLESPTATAVETTNFPVWKVPFPAVTICDPNQVVLSKAKRLVQRMSEGNKAVENELMEAFPHFREILKHNFVPFSNVSLLQNAITKNGVGLTELMRDLAPSCSDIMVQCQWKGVEVDCSKLFTRSLSDNGFCCSFNYAEPCFGRNCTSNRAKPSSLTPLYTASVGNKFGLRVTLRFDLKERFVPLVSTEAMRVMLHNWYNYPNQWSAADQLISQGQYTFIRVAAETTSSTMPVKKLPLQKSGCIFEEEDEDASTIKESGEMNGQSTYSRDNCLVDCRRINVMDYCHCQPYYYPSRDNVRLCDFRDLSCIFKHKVLLSRLRPNLKDLENSGNHLWDGQEGMDCDCSPQCNEISYRYETTSGNLRNSVSNPYHPENHSIIYVFFGKMIGTRYRRDLLMSWETLLSNAGGLFGLFMGFSLLSVVEFVYFFTVRLYFELRGRRNKKSLKKWSAKVRPRHWKIASARNVKLKLPVKDDFGRYQFDGRHRPPRFVY